VFFFLNTVYLVPSNLLFRSKYGTHVDELNRAVTGGQHRLMLNVRPQGRKIANATPYFPSFTDGK